MFRKFEKINSELDYFTFILSNIHISMKNIHIPSINFRISIVNIHILTSIQYSV